MAATAAGDRSNSNPGMPLSVFPCRVVRPEVPLPSHRVVPEILPCPIICLPGVVDEIVSEDDDVAGTRTILAAFKRYAHFVFDDIVVRDERREGAGALDAVVIPEMVLLEMVGKRDSQSGMYAPPGPGTMPGLQEMPLRALVVIVLYAMMAEVSMHTTPDRFR